MTLAYTVIVVCSIPIASSWDVVERDSGDHFKLTQSKFPRWKQSKIDNLGDLMYPFSAKHCLIILDNFRLIDLPASNYPAVIRTLVRIFIKRWGEISHSIIFGPHNLAPRNMTASQNGFLDCPISKYFTSVRQREIGSAIHTTHICFRIDVRAYWKNTKPWNCFTQIGLYPPAYYFIYFGSHKWNRMNTGRTASFRFMFPKTQTHSLQIFIYDDGVNQSEQFQRTIKLMKLYTIQHDYCDELFLAGIIESKKRFTHLNYLQPSACHVTEMWLVNPCHEWEVSPLLLPRFLDISNFPELSKATLPPPNFNLLWTILKVPSSDNVISRMVRFLHDCEELPPLIHNIKYTNPMEQLAHAYVHVWWSVMQNFTIRDNAQSTGCWAGVMWKDIALNKHPSHLVLEFASYSKGLYYFPYFVQDELSRLRFISCGERGFASIPFQELTNVFDKWIWLILGLSMVAITIPLKFSVILPHWMSLLKVLLEQGDTFEEIVVNKKNVRIILALFLMMGVILSNAYKNSNVYNMINSPEATFLRIL